MNSDSLPYKYDCYIRLFYSRAFDLWNRRRNRERNEPRFPVIIQAPEGSFASDPTGLLPGNPQPVTGFFVCNGLDIFDQTKKEISHPNYARYTDWQYVCVMPRGSLWPIGAEHEGEKFFVRSVVGHLNCTIRSFQAAAREAYQKLKTAPYVPGCAAIEMPKKDRTFLSAGRLQFFRNMRGNLATR